MTQITPDAHSSLVGGSTASRRIGCPRGLEVEWYDSPKGTTWRHTPETLRRLLRYDPETGKLFWRSRPASLFSNAAAHKRWERKNAGKEAFTTLSTFGYLKGNVLGKHYVAHRVAWAVHYGTFPAHEIDHINHQKTDNRISNLRDVTGSQNQRNRRLPADNTSGMIGVLWDRNRHKWRAYAYDAGKRWTIGYYACWAHAFAARRKAERDHGYHNNHGRAGA